MALPNPTLSWQMTALVPTSSTSAGFIAAINTAVASLTGTQKWEASTPTGSGTGLEAILLTPEANSPAKDEVTVLIGISNGTEPATAEIIDNNARIANRPLCSLGGNYATGTNWYDPSPYGGSVRYLELAPWCAVATSITDIFVIASAESIFIGARESDSVWYGTLLGSIIEPPSAAAAESANERVFGYLCTGTTGSYDFTTVMTGGNNWGNDNTGSSQCKGVFFSPVSPTATIKGEIIKSSGVTISATSGTDLAGNPLFQAVYVQVTGGGAILGRLRGVYFWEYALVRSIVQNSAAVDKGYCMSGSVTSPEQAIVFGNA